MPPENPLPNQQQPVQHPEQSSAQSRASEKVIRPMDASLTAAHGAPVPKIDTSVQNQGSVANAYDPSTGANVPQPAYKGPSDSMTIKTVASKHKSLMILAVLGLLSTLFAIFYAAQMSSAIHKLQLTNPSAASSAQLSLSILYVSIIINILVNGYFLFAKNPHSVATLLKIFIVLEIIAVFGLFWGVSPEKGSALFVDFIMLIYTYIVYNIVKTAPAM